MLLLEKWNWFVILNFPEQILNKSTQFLQKLSSRGKSLGKLVFVQKRLKKQCRTPCKSCYICLIHFNFYILLLSFPLNYFENFDLTLWFFDKPENKNSQYDLKFSFYNFQKFEATFLELMTHWQESRNKYCW